MTINVYGAPGYKKYISGIKTDTNRTVSMHAVPNGVVVGTGSVRRDGVYDANGKMVAVADARETRHVDHIKIPRSVKYMDVDAVFMGRLHWHFGHFLTECTVRMWGATKRPFQKYVFIHNPIVDKVPEYVYSFMAMLGVSREDIIILHDNMRFRNIYVPDVACGVDWSSSEFGNTFDAMADSLPNAKDTATKVYVSRLKMPEPRRTYGEEKVQNIFERNGYRVIYPETMPLSEQIASVRNADVLAGCAGTALHLALFMKPGGTVIQIKRNTETEDNAPMQILINKTKKLNSVFVCASIESVPSGHYTPQPQIIGMTNDMQNMMADMGFELKRADLTRDDVEWEKYSAAVAHYMRGARGRKIRRRISVLISQLIPFRNPRTRFFNYLARVLDFE